MPRPGSTTRELFLALVVLSAMVVGCETPVAGTAATTAPTSAAAADPTTPASSELSAAPEPKPASPAATAIVPGSVHRTTLAMTATYDVAVRLAVADRRLAGGIDRLLLNTVMAKLGALDLRSVTVDGHQAHASI